MAVATPATPTITSDATFLLPAMAAEPLNTALNNSNHQYLYHSPALVDVCPMHAVGTPGQFWIPILPSADGVLYEFQHRILPAFNGTVTIQVEWAATLAGAWTSIYGPTATAAMTNGVWFRHVHTATIPATARILRVSYTAWGGNGRIGQILAHPTPSNAVVPFVAPYGVTPSGFRVYDDGLLNNGGAAGQPVNTEMLDRCRRNAVKILQDRQQVAFSLAQEITRGAVLYPGPGATGETWMLMGHSRFSIPGLRDGATGTLTIYVIASMAAGVPASMVKVIVGTQSALFAADGVCNSWTLTATGGLNEAMVYVSHNGANLVYLHAVAALWQPGV